MESCPLLLDELVSVVIMLMMKVVMMRSRVFVEMPKKVKVNKSKVAMFSLSFIKITKEMKQSPSCSCD